MEHKGVPYQIVQTANPSGFRWSVQLDATRSRTGTSNSRGNAIFRAVSVIDKALKAKPVMPPSAHSI